MRPASEGRRIREHGIWVVRKARERASPLHRLCRCASSDLLRSEAAQALIAFAGAAPSLDESPLAPQLHRGVVSPHLGKPDCRFIVISEEFVGVADHPGRRVDEVQSIEVQLLLNHLAAPDSTEHGDST